MASNTDQFDFLEELANTIREPSAKLLEEFRNDSKKRILSDKLATKADKLIIADSKRNRNKRPGGFTGRVAKRIGGAAVGGAGNAIAGIPIVGAMFRALGQEAANTLRDKKQYNKELRKQRELELKLIEQADMARKKKEKLENEGSETQPRPSRSSGIPSAAIEKLSNAAAGLEAAAISIAPAIQTFDEIVVKVSEAIDRLVDHEPQKIMDTQAIEYLHAAEFYAQETAAGVERLVSSHGKSVGKDIGNIKWHMARANGSVGRMEKMMEQETPSNATSSTKLEKDVGNIKWHMARANGSVGRMEKMMKQAALDRITEIDLAQETLKVEKMQVENQEDQKLIGVLGVLSNLIGGGGLLKAVGGLGKAAMGAVAIVGAFEVGQAIGAELSKWLDTTEWFKPTMEKLFVALDHVLAFFGNDEAKNRLDLQGDDQNVKRAQDLRRLAGEAALSPQDEQYVREHGTLPGMSVEDFRNEGHALTMGMTGKSSQEEMNKKVAVALMNTAVPATADDFNRQSARMAELRERKQDAPSVISAPSTTNNNSQTVMPSPLTADPQHSRHRELR